MQHPLLQIQNLSVSFASQGAEVQALHHINFSVYPGEITAVVGESGSGKSVTALSVLRLLASPPAKYTHGSIQFCNNDGDINLLSATTNQLAHIRGNKIAMIFQEPMTSLNPVLTCGEQVMEVILQHRIVTRQQAQAQVIALFTQVQLPHPEEMLHRYPHELSGGQKQRVMIAMAMSCSPDILICDEPTTALDVTVQKSILQLIKSLQQQNNMGVLFITHDLGVVAEIADRVVVLYKGEVVEQNTVQQLFQYPQHPYTKALLACRPILYTKGMKLPVVSDFMKGEAPIAYKETLASDAVPSNNNASVLFEVNHLKVHYKPRESWFSAKAPTIKAIDDISFNVMQGEVLGLVGESGCGKSTLGRALLRLITVTDGEIKYKNENLLTRSPNKMKALRKELQFIFQDPYASLNPSMTIGNAITEPMQVHGLYANAAERKQKAIDLLQAVGLPALHYDRYPHQFSGGQRQRIVIARALAVQPSFIVCDEIVSALDVSVQAQVLNLLNDLKQAFKFTLVFISHDLAVVRYISDRIMVMQHGKIVEIGTAEQVYHQPATAYTKQLLASIPKGL